MSNLSKSSERLYGVGQLQIVKKRYTLEFPPIYQHTKRDGSVIRNLIERDMRIIDAYTGAPVGIVSYVWFDKKYQGRLCFKDWPEVKEPIKGWGERFDLAAEAVWRTYNSNLVSIRRRPRGIPS